MLSSTELMEMPKASEIKFIFVCGSGVGCGDCGDGREHKKSTLNSFFLYYSAICYIYEQYKLLQGTCQKHDGNFPWWKFYIKKITLMDKWYLWKQFANYCWIYVANYFLENEVNDECKYKAVLRFKIIVTFLLVLLSYFSFTIDTNPVENLHYKT